MPIHQPIAQVWPAEKYAAPDAPPSELAAALGRQLATRLQQHQGLYVSDHRAGVMVYVSEGVQRLLGHSLDVFAANQYELIHPDDLPVVSAITVLVNRYIVQRAHDPLTGLLVSTDYRIRHAQGHYVRVLRQNIILSREPNGAMVGSAGIFTDITQHKHTTEVRYHVNRPDFAAFAREEGVRLLPVALSAREQQVLALVLEGLTSQQIGEQLHLTRATVGTHRRNIKRKVGSHDPGRLLRYLDAECSV
jgi:DNA-binding CsgD family transcriptional regulator